MSKHNTNNLPSSFSHSYKPDGYKKPVVENEETVDESPNNKNELEHTHEVVKGNISRTMTVIGGAPLNLRENKTTESQIIGRLSEGSEVEVNEEYEDGWAQITTSSGAEGYVKAEFLKLK